MRVGIFGGSFDPPHEGHLAIAKAAKLQAHLDKVIFIPAARNPLKETSPVTQDRIRLLKELTKKEASFEVSDREIKKPPPSYTIDTILELKKDGSDLFLIIGADVASRFTEWKNYKEIISSVNKILVYPRDGIKFDLLEKMELLKCPEIPISSTKIRTK
jgi:nicotinate-nucleotide adenylyltransferase